MQLIETALAYLDYGLRPIPLNREGQPNPAWKRPDLKKIPSWEPYQKRAPTEAEITAWFEDEKANIGSVIPQGMIIVDLDGGEEHGHQGAKAAEAMLNQAGVIIPEDAPRVITGNGYQIYLRVPKDWPKIPGEKFLSTNGKKPFVEILTNGSYGILPPSTHPSGRQYTWAVSPDGPIPQAPQALLALIEAYFRPKDKLGAGSAETNTPGWVQEAMKGAEWGSIDNTAAKLAGFFIKQGIPADIVIDIMSATFARRCTKNGQPAPMAPGDLRRVVESIARGHAERHPEERPCSGPQSIGQVMRNVVKGFSDGPGKFYPTCIPKLDFYLSGGFQGGELAYMGAYPGVGKTALALQMARDIAAKGTHVLVVSREMRNAAIVTRMLAQNSPLSASTLRKGNLDPTQMDQVKKAGSDLSKLPIYFIDDASTIQQVTAVVEKSQARHTGLLVIVDYLQIMRVDAAQAERRHQVEAASKTLKGMALDFNIPVLCMSSLSRNPDKKNKDHEPGLDSLRESGELEHDADIVLMLHRKFQSHEMKMIVRKNRNGHVGSLKLHFDDAHLSFHSLEDSEEVPEESDARYGS
jgi:archaellum biogenesis ATPase FlaH